jgi:hypothetical protein
MPHETPSAFLVIVLLVMLVVQCVNPQEEPAFLGCSSRVREKASKWVAVCDSWLQAKSYKHSSTPIDIWPVITGLGFNIALY